MVGKIKNEHLSITIVPQLTFQAVFLSLSASSFRLVSRSCQFAFAADRRCADHSGGEERDAPLLHVVFVSFVYHKFSTNCRVCLAAFLLRRIPFTLYLYFGHHIMTLTLTCGNLMLMTLISSDTNSLAWQWQHQKWHRHHPQLAPSTCCPLLLHLTRF